ncbi:MAG: ParB N-terminal domain-containing protein [Bacteroidales bacterium]
MKKIRILRLNKNYIPCIAYENEEIYPNGIFHFNISRIIEHIISGQLVVEQEDICVPDWYKTHYTSGSLDEKHLKTVTLEKPVIQAEISPGRYNIIDGNHRLEKAYREKVENIKSYKLKGEQLIDYFIDVRGYQAFVEYWNSKLSDSL